MQYLLWIDVTLLIIEHIWRWSVLFASENRISQLSLSTDSSGKCNSIKTSHNFTNQPSVFLGRWFRANSICSHEKRHQMMIVEDIDGLNHFIPCSLNRFVWVCKVGVLVVILLCSENSLPLSKVTHDSFINDLMHK